MSTKHRTKIVGLPTSIVATPLLECDVEVIKKCHRHNPSTRRNSFSETQYWILYKHDEDGLYYAFAVPLSELQKKDKKKIVGTLSTRKAHGGFYSTGKFTAPSDKLFVVYIQNQFSAIYDADEIVDNYQKYIGTKKVLDSDWIISCGTDFTYETPYGQMVLQPKLNRNHIELRKKFADDPKITLYFDKKNIRLFRAVQKLMVEKYKVVGDRKWKTKDGRPDYDGYKPWEFQKEFPQSTYSHLDKPIVWTYLYVGNTCREWHEKKKHIQMFSGDSPRESLSDLRRRSLGVTVKSLKQVDEFMEEYSRYVRLVRPKQTILG